MRNSLKNIKIIVIFLLILSVTILKMPIAHAEEMNFYDRIRQECIMELPSTEQTTEFLEDSDEYIFHYNQIVGNVHEILAGKNYLKGEDSNGQHIPIEGVCVTAGNQRNLYR